MAKVYSINLTDLYKRVNISKKDNIKDLITAFNYKLFIAVYNIINNKSRTIDILNATVAYLSIVKFTASKVEDTNYKDILNEVYNMAKDIVNEFQEDKNPAKSLAYIIGTSSETKNNYTANERFAILIAIAHFMEITFDI